MSPTTTRTTNRLHFSDIAPDRFEDFCLQLIFPLHPWKDIKHYGRLGSDGGVDILATEVMEDSVEREWFVQCRRYKTASKKTLKKALNDALDASAKPPSVFLIVLACDVSRSAHEFYVKYAAEKGVSTPLIWTASLLEARLYNERRDLLFTYFGISEAREARRRERSIVRNIGLKKRLQKELLKRPDEIDWNKARRNPTEKFPFSRAIVHSVDDSSYPEVPLRDEGISGWFRLEIWNFYHNGIEFILRVEYAICDANGKWGLVEYGQKFDEDKYRQITVLMLGRIPYENIVEVDVNGDEFYSEPHFYCRYANGGEPYEGFRYVIANEGYPHELPREDEFDPQASGLPIKKARPRRQ